MTNQNHPSFRLYPRSASFSDSYLQRLHQVGMGHYRTIGVSLSETTQRSTSRTYQMRPSRLLRLQQLKLQLHRQPRHHTPRFLSPASLRTTGRHTALKRLLRPPLQGHKAPTRRRHSISRLMLSGSPPRPNWGQRARQARPHDTAPHSLRCRRRSSRTALAPAPARRRPVQFQTHSWGGCKLRSGWRRLRAGRARVEVWLCLRTCASRRAWAARLGMAASRERYLSVLGNLSSFSSLSQVLFYFLLLLPAYTSILLVPPFLSVFFSPSCNMRK